MPVGFIPTKSGAHRLACQILYKNLLTACAGFQPSDPSKPFLSSHLQSLVRYRFHHDRNIQSPKRIQDALHFGRKAFHLLDEASKGTPEALNQLISILSSVQKLTASNNNTQKHMNKDPGNSPVNSLEQNQFTEQATQPTTNLPDPDVIPILQRPAPLSKIKGGQRYVPRYIVAHGIPFLRYGKPQPYGLSLYIRGAVKRKERRWKHKEQMEQVTQLGYLEDQWDREMHDKFGVAKDDHAFGSDGSWAKASMESEVSVMGKIRAKDEFHLARGKKLWEISLEEERLALEEKHAVKQERRRLRRQQNSAEAEAVSGAPFLGE